MVIALWRRGNSGGAPMSVETLRSGSASIFRHRLVARDLLSDRALRLSLRQRRHRRHRGTRGTGRNRWLGLFVPAAEAHIGQALQQRHPGLLGMLLLGF